MTMCVVSIVSPQMQHGFVTVERDLIDISVRMRSMLVRFPLWKASLSLAQSWLR